MLNKKMKNPITPKKEITIVIPIFNEEKNIKQLYQQIKRVLDEQDKTYEIIFIDDGSKDNSFREMKTLKTTDSAVKIIKFRKNFGQTAAFDAGFKHAKGKIIITLDGDMQNDPTDIPRLIQKLEQGYDVAVGWRHKRKDRAFKRISSRFAHLLRKLIIKEKIHDPGCTLKAYKKECFDNLELYGEMHRYIPHLLSFQGFKIAEVKVQHHPRKHGRTKYNMLRLPKGFFDLLFIKFWNDYSTRPIHFFGAMALAQYTLSMAIFIEQIIKAIIIRELIAGPLFLAGILLVITGTLTLIFGFIAEIMIRMYYKQEKNYSIEKIID